VKRLLIVLATAALVAAVGPATASADTGLSTGTSWPGWQDRQDAKAFARDYWEGRGLYAYYRCPNGVRIKLHPMRDRGLVGYVWSPSGCTIHLNSRVYWNWSKLCTTVVHEYGHIVGREHARDPRSVMYPGWPNPVWGKRFHACEY
jgi:hypothetical protein